MSTSTPDKLSGGEEQKDAGKSGPQLLIPSKPTKRRTEVEVLKLPNSLTPLESIEEHSERSSRLGGSRRGSDNTIRVIKKNELEYKESRDGSSTRKSADNRTIGTDFVTVAGF